MYLTLLSFLLLGSLCAQDMVTEAEYYVDSDPGQGNGISIVASDGFFDSNTEDLNIQIDSDILSLGAHQIYVRFRDDAGYWGQSKGVTVTVRNPQIGNYVTEAEYFVDSDPGLGYGVSLQAVDGVFNENTEELFASIEIGSDAAVGQHTIYIRGKSSDGKWGETQSKVVEVLHTGPWFVSPLGSDESGGGSMEYPFASVQYGIDASQDGDTVLVQPGTYTENINFNGKSIVVGSMTLTTGDTSHISQTIIDGGQSGSVVSFAANEDTNTVLTGFSLTNGSGTEVFVLKGGGIYCRDSNPRLSHLIIRNNSALVGGGIYARNSAVEISNSIIRDNVAADEGGGLYAGDIQISITESIFASNEAITTGGGLYFEGVSSGVLDNVRITNNHSDTGGGMRLNSAGTNLQITKCLIDSNYSTENGAGIYVSPGSLSFFNSTLVDNIITGGGSVGGIYHASGNLEVQNSILWRNDGESLAGTATVDLGYSCVEGGGAIPSEGIINSDPQFISGPNHSYLLSVSSPCKDTGNPDNDEDSDTWEIDPDDQDPDGTRIDMGAFYYHQTYFGPTWHISPNGSDETGEGSGTNPLASIQAGIILSGQGDTILVRPGTYVENINLDGKNVVVSSLQLTTNDTSYISSTIIDGGSSGSVVTIRSGETNACVLNGFVIRNGLSFGGDGLNDGYGGGIFINNYSSPILDNLIVEDNESNHEGGGILVDRSNPIIRNSIIRGNAGCGIAILTTSSPLIEGCTVTGNTDMYGAGIKIAGDGGTTEIRHTLISENIATQYGGGLYASGSVANPVVVNLVNVTIVNNEAPISGGGGILGGMESDINVVNSILWSNQPNQIFQDNASSIVNINFSDIQNGFEGDSNLNLDPQFDTEPGQAYSLRGGSPCIDSGNPDLDNDDISWETDSDDQDPDGTRMDMGASYYHQEPDYTGTIWHISVEGSDEIGDGSTELPFATIQKGVNLAASNDTIQIGSGTYSEPIDIQSKSLYLIGVDSTETIIAADGVYSQAHIEGQVVSFQNLSFESNGTGGDYMLWAECTSCTGTDSMNVQFVDVFAEGSYEKGFFLTGQRTRLNVMNSMFKNFHPPTGAWDGGVFALNNSYASFDHCVFNANQSNGAGQVIYATSGSSVEINFSSFSGNGTSPGSIALNDGSSIALSNSILWGTPNFQLVILGNGSASSANISYCDIANGQFGIDDQSGVLDLEWGPGNINITPEFNSPSDLALQEFSPCIDHGNPDLDSDGNIWEIDPDDQDPDGTRFDMGARYYNQIDSIAPVIALNIPDFTELTQNGDTLTISWEASDNIGLDWAKLFFTSNGGASFSRYDSVDANLGEIEWIAPNIISNECNFAIWVSDLTGNISADTLNGTFSIDDGTVPSISILNPTNLTSVKEGDTLLVAWEAADNVGIEHFEFFYSNEPSEAFYLLDVIPSDTSTYNMHMDYGVSDSARVKMIVLDLAGNSSEDVSDYFSITDNTNPMISHFSIPDSTIFGIGSVLRIQVSATDNVEVTGLDLNYSTDAGNSWLPIVQGLFPVQGRPTYSWLIPDIPGDCQIQAIVTDAVALTDTSYSDVFTIIVEYPILEASLLQIRPSADMQLHFSQGMETGVSTGIQVIGTIGGVYEVEGTSNGQDVTISAVNGFVSLDTLMLVLTASEWTNSFGYGLDGNGDGIYDGSPIDNDTSYTLVSAAGDYDQNSILNFDDFNTFVLAWNNSATDYELAPHLGEIPFINIQPDSSFDIFDLATFASMWNWSAGAFQTSPQISNYDVVSMDATQNGNFLSVNLETTGLIASQTIIKYDPNTVSVSVSDPGLAKVSSESMVFVDANPDSGYITITSSQLSGTIEDQLLLELTPKTKQRYSIEVALQGSGKDANVTQKRTSIELIPIPTTYSLSQNYPNPFNASTMIEYGLPKNSELNISIFDIRGRFVKEMHSGPQQAGYHAVQWSGLNEYGLGVASGVYFIVLHTSEYRMAKKALILK